MYVARVRIVNTAGTKGLRGWGSHWNEQGNYGGYTPNHASIRTLYVATHKLLCEA